MCTVAPEPIITCRMAQHECKYLLGRHNSTAGDRYGMHKAKRKAVQHEEKIVIQDELTDGGRKGDTYTRCCVVAFD